MIKLKSLQLIFASVILTILIACSNLPSNKKIKELISAKETERSATAVDFVTVFAMWKQSNIENSEEF